MARLCVLGIEQFPKAQLEEVGALRKYPRTNIRTCFRPNRGYFVFYLSKNFRRTHIFENWEISFENSRRNIPSRHMFRPIARNQQYLMITTSDTE